jgi:hypothetical protein
MSPESVPTLEDWGDLTADLDVAYAHRMFGGKTVIEATPLFLENPIERADELRFSPAPIFNYYVFAFAAAVLSPESRAQSDLASCFLRLIRERAAEAPAALAKVWARLHPVVVAVAVRQEFYDADVDIYGSFPVIKDEVEAAMRHIEENGA